MIPRKMLKYLMKIFESSLRPVSADKRLVAREVAFNHNSETMKPVLSMRSLCPRKGKTDSASQSSPPTISRPNSRDSLTQIGMLREDRAFRRVRSAEKHFAVRRDRDIARLQLERAWLKRKIVSLLRWQSVHYSIA